MDNSANTPLKPDRNCSQMASPGFEAAGTWPRIRRACDVAAHTTGMPRALQAPGADAITEDCMRT